MAGRRFKTQADIDRYVAQGYGQGEGSNYKPWLRVQDVKSHGKSQKVLGKKTNRVHHLLSGIEYGYFHVLEFSEQVLDIREAYPLFPNEQALDIASQLGIRYPKYSGSQLNFVMTTDFLITLNEPDGKTSFAARPVKPDSDLFPCDKLERMIEKLELEKALLHAQGISNWKLVTEKTVGAVLIENLIWLKPTKNIERQYLNADLQLQFMGALEHYANGERKLSSHIRAAASSCRIPYTAGILLFKYLIFNKFIRMDITNYSLSLDSASPALDFSCTAVSSMASLRAA